MLHDLIIFDCDGTLTDSEVLNNQAVFETLSGLGFPQYTLEYCMEHFVGATMDDIRTLVEQENQTKLPPDFISRFIQTAHALQPSFLREAPGAVAAVRELSTAYKTCVGSNGERQNVVESLQAIGVWDVFGQDRVFTKDQVARGKPAPDIYLLAARVMGVDPSRTWVVEDTPTGTRAGVSAGMSVIGYTGVSYHKGVAEGELQAAGAVITFSNWPDIVAYIKAHP